MPVDCTTPDVCTLRFRHGNSSRATENCSPRFDANRRTPVVIYKNGEWQREAVEHTRINVTEILAAARTQGLESLDQVACVILERNGAVSFISKNS